MDWNEDACEAAALADYEAHKGKLLRVWLIDGYINGTTSNTVSGYPCDPPLIVQVDDPSLPMDIVRRIDDWFDPIWTVTVLRPSGDVTKDARVWVYGPHCYQIGVGPDVGNSDWEVIE